MNRNTLAIAWLLLVGPYVASASAGGNPLNLPLPNDPARPGIVVLHGGGPLSDEIFERFVELVGGKEARIVLIPSGTYVRGRQDGVEFNETAGAFEARMSRRFGSWVALKQRGRVAAFRFLFTDNQEDADDPRFVAALADATGVWIPAAYQGKLDWRFAPHYPEKTSLFQKALREVVARGGVVGGSGGGMAAMPEVMIMGDSGQEAGPAEARLRYGLGLFNGAIVDQYFDARSGRLERFTGLLKDTANLSGRVSWPAAPRNMIGLAAEPGTALLLQGNTVRVIGDNRGHVFLKSNGDRTITWRVLRPSDGKVDLVAFSELFQGGKLSEARHGRAGGKWKNPFGIPEPINPARPGAVVLHGGGKNLDLIQIYPGLSGVPRPHLVHCPAADEEFRPSPTMSLARLLPRLEGYFHEWVEMSGDGRLASIRFLTTCERADANREEFVRPLLQADAVWISGGSQGDLGDLLVDAKSPTRFQREVFDVVRRGGVVGGTSAGAAIMPEIMTLSTVQREGRPADARIGHGLGMLKNVLAEQHFQGAGRGGRIERFTRLLLDNERLRKVARDDGPVPEDLIGMAIEERTALILQENHVRVFGQQKAHVFLKSTDQRTITWHALQPGDAAFLYSGPGGPVLELDDWRIP